MKNTTKMKMVRNTVFTAMLATLVALPLVGNIGNSSAAADTHKTGKTGAAIPAGTYALDPAHSIIGFAVRHFEINWVEGRVKDFVGTVNYNAADVTKSSVSFTAKIESLDTGVEPRNQHLRTPDFFDAARYPEMKFVSTKIEKKGKDKYILHGDLTMKGVTKQIEFPFAMSGAIKDPWGNTRFGIEAHTNINRRDFGINYGTALAGGGLDVGNEITINFNLEAIKPEPKTTAQTPANSE
jgi:polyisoprenoid-binding protein YceI